MTSEAPGQGPRNPADERLSYIDEVRDWVRAVALGLGDTLKDVLAAGRRGAKETTDRYWARFDEKTRHRRD